MAEKFKFKVSIKELSFEFEGSREQSQLAQAGLTRTLGNLFETQSKVLAMEPVKQKPPAPTLFEVPVEPEMNGQAVPPAPAPVPVKARRSRKTSNGEPSIPTILLDLKSSGFFKEPRTLQAITDNLKTNGRNISPNSLTGPLGILTRKKELFRTNTDLGYVYKDSPFNESPRTENTATEPTE